MAQGKKKTPLLWKPLRICLAAFAVKLHTAAASAVSCVSAAAGIRSRTAAAWHLDDKYVAHIANKTIFAQDGDERDPSPDFTPSKVFVVDVRGRRSHNLPFWCERPTFALFLAVYLKYNTHPLRKDSPMTTFARSLAFPECFGASDLSSSSLEKVHLGAGEFWISDFWNWHGLLYTAAVWSQASYHKSAIIL